MQAIENVDVSLATPVLAVTTAESPTPEADIHHMRALRRKARRISTYARWSTTALNALSVQVESDIAALQH